MARTKLLPKLQNEKHKIVYINQLVPVTNGLSQQQQFVTCTLQDESHKGSMSTLSGLNYQRVTMSM